MVGEIDGAAYTTGQAASVPALVVSDLDAFAAKMKELFIKLEIPVHEAWEEVVSLAKKNV